MRPKVKAPVLTLSSCGCGSTTVRHGAPATAGPDTVQAVFQVLAEQGLDYDVMSPDDFTKTSPVERASMAVALVRGLDVPTVELVRALRDMPTPVFVVAEQLSEAEEVTLLHAGVHDVVRMTASPHLIGARLHAMFHHVHVGEPSQSPYEFANVSVRPDRHLVFVGDEEVPLTRTEFRLLVVLAQQHDRAVSREVLADLLHDSRHLAPHAIESHVSRLRTKIVEAGGPRLIESVRGVGYRLRVPS